MKVSKPIYRVKAYRCPMRFEKTPWNYFLVSVAADNKIYAKWHPSVSIIK